MANPAEPQLAVGVDLVEVDRIAEAHRRHPERFLTRHFTPREQDECGAAAHRLATRWAAKEAAAKALGTGIGPIGWHDIEVRCDSAGAPRLVFTGRAAETAQLAPFVHRSTSLRWHGRPRLETKTHNGERPCESAPSTTASS